MPVPPRQASTIPPPPSAPGPAPDPMARTLADAVATARDNGRHTLMTLCVLLGFAAVILLGALQSRHGWPVQVADFAYAVYAAYVATLYLWIYRRG